MKRRGLLAGVAAAFAAPVAYRGHTELVASVTNGAGWAEEGTGTAGTAPDSSLWTMDTWSPANELQSYTTSTNNAFYNGAGQLVIRARKETTNGKPYSSAKLSTRKTDGSGRFRHGLFQARIKVPAATGVFPAFWLLGEDNLAELTWPRCGEIDIMEAPASTATLNQVYQGTHMADSTGNDVPVGVPPTMNNAGWGDWHIYSVDWTPGQIDFYIDNQLTGTVSKSSVGTARWPFDRGPMSIILTLAVGGWAGTPDPSWTQQDMLIDFVRIYP